MFAATAFNGLTLGYGQSFVSVVLMGAFLPYAIIATFMYIIGGVGLYAGRDYKQKQQIPFRICTQCGRVISDESVKFCPNCGKQLQ